MSTQNGAITDENKYDDKLVHLLSSEGTKEVVQFKLVKQSKLIRNLIEDSIMDSTEDDPAEVPLENVDTETLRKVIEFWDQNEKNKMNEIEKPLRDTNIGIIAGEWYGKYINIEQESLFKLITAANYLDVKSLLDLSCAKVASMIKGKSPEEIRSLFNIKNDFTPEEEAKIREENKWCEDL
eukprot:maker-scaffold_3-snap-gene-14.48-mRNA-1 protein AED:0.04 eAED:0.04 QI:130/1/1/1/1/1/3/99/180